MSEVKVSADVEGGHLTDDGKTRITPLAGKTSEQIYRAHHALDEVIGKPLPGSQPHEGKVCQCAHCAEHLAKKSA